jgi:hypothetical protein
MNEVTPERVQRWEEWERKKEQSRRRARRRYYLAMAPFWAAFIALLLYGTWLSWPKARPNEARAVLAAQGYTQVEITGARFLGCGREDVYRTGFRAVGPTGIPVKGIVCDGIFKGATVRLEEMSAP